MACQRRRRVMVAEDQEDMRSLLHWALEREGYEVFSVPDGLALQKYLYSALVQHVAELPDALVSDIRMPGASGLQILSILNQREVPLPVVLITAFGDRRTHEEASRMGAITVLDKPFSIDDLKRVLREIFEKAPQTRQTA